VFLKRQSYGNANKKAFHPGVKGFLEVSVLLIRLHDPDLLVLILIAISKVDDIESGRFAGQVYRDHIGRTAAAERLVPDELAR
jgi:hypothetical protein